MAENNTTSQTQPLVNDQVQNEAGGYVWEVTDMKRLHRFLCLGSEAGTYYVRDNLDLGKQNVTCIERLIENGDGEKVVDELKKFSVEGRTAKQEPLILALAMCARSSDLQTKQAAYKVLAEVCRIPTHLFMFVDNVERISKMSKGTGWGRAQRRAIQQWYNDKNAKSLALAVTKYRQRNGWSHKDLLRLAHIKPANDGIALVFKYIVKGLDAVKEEFKIEDSPDDVKVAMTFLEAVEDMKNTGDEVRAVTLIEEHGLVREHIPTNRLKSRNIWKALLKEMPMTAMIRNLGKMTSAGVLMPESNEVKHICEKLRDDMALQKARIHPFNVLLALRTYQSGQGDKGKMKWMANQSILDALEHAFYASFKNIEPTGKRFLLALDVSGSMTYGSVNGAKSITASLAAAAMLMVTARTEPKEHYDILAFSDKLVPLPINASMKLDDVCKAAVDVTMGPTDCAQPMLWATENKKPVDVFIVYTDCETWAGPVHPAQALQQYRKAMDIQAKLIVCAMTSTGFTLAEPNDAGMLDIAGFDSGAPEIIHSFAMGHF
ncbi:RNA-binding protein RO60-like [Ptychodera flava]|uniref:RNA-binding protein RO60-like n=1 Tax=Ptychodera flava TaxID=63121 RepID=UPI00396A0D53